LGLIAGTILVHVAGFRMMLTWLDRWYAGDGRPQPGIGRIMIFASLMMAILHHLEAALWATVYIGLGILDEWDTAVYFSFVTMTTVGYGDVTLTGRASGNERHAAVRAQRRLPVRYPAALLDAYSQERLSSSAEIAHEFAHELGWWNATVRRVVSFSLHR
jgi:hypothetical protein